MKEKYKEFCAHTEGVNIFMQPWFLDAVCSAGEWNVCMDIAKNGEVNGVLVYYMVKKWGFTTAQMPFQTAYMGLWIKEYPSQKLHQKTSHERNTLKSLIAQLPSFAYFSQSFSPQFSYWQPFQWAGFQHQLKVTHIVEGLDKPTELFNNFKENTQKKIKKAAKNVVVEKNDDSKIVYDIYSQIQNRYGRRMSYSLSFLENLDRKLKKNKAGQLYLARSVDDGAVHAALYIIWDKTTAYYWLGGSDERYRNSGALSLLIWEILKEMGSKGIKQFDFTGSSAENLETFFTSFGAKKVAYLHLNRINNRFLSLFYTFKKAVIG
ncbi:MAG: GNAT family N-acetyltransferase [Saprospiraceae bacterium]|nr:GNAT family N-acetyltransferase [Saprospiraceae bacterium]